MDNRIQGLDQLRASFDTLSEDMRTKTAFSMVVSAGGVLRTEAKRLAQSQGLRRTGALINNIVIKREKAAPDGTAQYHLGVRHGRALGRKAKKVLTVRKTGRIAVKYVNDPFYWRFLERGHKIVPRSAGQTGGGTTSFKVRQANGKIVSRTKHWSASSITGRRRLATRSVAATPFIEPALKNKQAEAIEAMKKRLAAIIAKANKK